MTKLLRAPIEEASAVEAEVETFLTTPSPNAEQGNLLKVLWHSDYCANSRLLLQSEKRRRSDHTELELEPQERSTGTLNFVLIRDSSI